MFDLFIFIKSPVSFQFFFFLICRYIFVKQVASVKRYTQILYNPFGSITFKFESWAPLSASVALI